MKSFIFLFHGFLLFILTKNVQAQQDSSRLIYDAGVEAFKSEQYLKADSLFQISVKMKPAGTTYYNISACKLKLGNKKAYCENLVYACSLEDNESRVLFLKDCGSIDTFYLDKLDTKTTWEGRYSATVRYHLKGVDKDFIFKYDRYFFPFISNVSFADGKEVYMIVEEMPEFIGGMSAMYKYISNQINFPADARERGISGKVFVKFLISDTGEIKDVVVVKGMPSCFECEREAVRVIKGMPSWKPGKQNGQNVHVYYNLPISYKVN